MKGKKTPESKLKAIDEKLSELDSLNVDNMDNNDPKKILKNLLITSLSDFNILSVVSNNSKTKSEINKKP